MLNTEGVECEAAGGERVEDVLDFGGALARADRADADPWLSGEVKAPGAIQVGAARVVGEPPALEDRRER